jgi:hypothetical protein
VPEKTRPEEEMLKGTLDMMIQRTLVMGDAHGHTIATIIERTSEDVLQVEQGSLYPACIAWKIAAGSPRTGARPRTTAGRSFTGLRRRAESNCSAKRYGGNA